MKQAPNQYYEDFIRNILKCKSFIHNGDYGTNFTDSPTDYGKCYGIYNPSDIQFMDGPF